MLITMTVPFLCLGMRVGTVPLSAVWAALSLLSNTQWPASQSNVSILTHCPRLPAALNPALAAYMPLLGLGGLA